MVDEYHYLLLRERASNFIETAINAIASDDSIVASEIKLVGMEKSFFSQRLEGIGESVETGDIHMFSTVFDVFGQRQIGSDGIRIRSAMRKQKYAL